ncbi:hypothetical protein CMT52_17105 [Elizabethkingia anophelis]|nr:hypothetical protein [Elizabethkingia anophelis]
MESSGKIYIKELPVEENKIFEEFKKEKKISVNTKALLYLISEYGRLKNSEKNMLKRIDELKEERDNLYYKMEDQTDVLLSFKKLLENL